VQPWDFGWSSRVHLPFWRVGVYNARSDPHVSSWAFQRISRKVIVSRVFWDSVTSTCPAVWARQYSRRSGGALSILQTGLPSKHYSTRLSQIYILIRKISS
jgi:hypothetical protein